MRGDRDWVRRHANAKPMSFHAELKRRNVIRVGVAWLALAWLLVAMCALLFPALGLPIRALRWIILALLAAWPPVLWLAWRYELTPAGLRIDRGAGAPNPHGARTAQRLDQLTLVIVLAALSLSLLRQFITQHAPVPAARDAAVAAPPAAVAPPVVQRPVDPHSLAVLPFANLSPSADDAYFADGLSEELIDVLARIQGLKVVSRTSSFVFRDRSAGVREIAAQLGVANLIVGSVRRQGDEVRIAVQLVDARDDSTRWSQTYDRRLVDIFHVQEEISQATADALAQSLGVRRVEVSPPTGDLEAYELFLRGRQLFAQRGSNLPAARDLLERAVARDARFADAWAALAATWYVWRAYLEAPDGIDTLAQSGDAAAKALAIEPRHPGALAVSARLAADAGDRLRHADMIAQALELEPNNANTALWQGLGFFEVGHLREAHASFERAQRLDPLSGLHIGWLGITTALLGDRAAATPMLERAHELGWRGPASRALFFLARGAGDERGLGDAFLAWLHDDDGMPEAQRELARALAPALTEPARLASAQDSLLEAAEASPGLEWATLLDVFGKTDAAVAMSLRTEPAATQPLLLSLWYPQFEDFRENARFVEFADRHGLMAYWRSRGPPDHCVVGEGPSPGLECDR